MSKILRKPQAEADLVEIWVYIAEDNLIAADSLLDLIDEKLKTLADTPLMGRARDEILSGILSFAVGNYVIFYRPTDGGIEVVRVLHGARDLETIFG